jgi:UDP-N-acetylmuramate--alanine ligase
LRQPNLTRLDWTEIARPAIPGHDAGVAGCVHLVGIGGIGMSGIAEVLATLGYQISGSDLRESENTRHLEGLGIKIYVGHGADQVDLSTDVVVVSSAIDETNPEVRVARQLRIPVIPRAEMLAELMRVKCGVAVAGAHGKTTTTSLVASVLGQGGFDPTILIGGRLKSLGGTNARLGRSRYMVAEADESDGSFLLLKPTIGVVTNIDREHMDYYGTMDRLTDAYVDFINGIPFYGRAVLCSNCDLVSGLLGRLKKRFLTYGTSLEADISAREIEQDGLTTSFEVLCRGVSQGRISVGMPGEHTVLNALAAVAVGLEFGMKFEDCAVALASFDGIMRRFEVKGVCSGVTVVDDYGHHPTEIRATLGAARKAFDGRIVALFQPHRYSRTADLFEEFCGAFADADQVVVTDVYGAGESPIEGIDGARLAAAITGVRDGVEYVARGDRSSSTLADAVAAKARAGDVVITLGAGDVTKLGPQILEVLGRRGD